MPAAPNRNGKAESRVVKKETFSDGSELIELENGALLLRESKFSIDTHLLNATVHQVFAASVRDGEKHGISRKARRGRKGEECDREPREI